MLGKIVSVYIGEMTVRPEEQSLKNEEEWQRSREMLAIMRYSGEMIWWIEIQRCVCGSEGLNIIRCQFSPNQTFILMQFQLESPPNSFHRIWQASLKSHVENQRAKIVKPILKNNEWVYVYFIETPYFS